MSETATPDATEMPDAYPVATTTATTAQLLARRSTEERIAIYLYSIRKMMLFFTVITVVGLVLSVVLALVGIHAIVDANQANQQ